MSFNKVVREGNNICQGADKTYLTAYLQGEEAIRFYTPFPYVRWSIIEKVKNEPQGQYWVSITYKNTGVAGQALGCKETVQARVLRAQRNSHYNLIKGKILGIVFTKESYQPVATYKIAVENINGYISKHLLTDRNTGNRGLQSKINCSFNHPAAAYPGSVIIDDIIPITGGYEYEFRVFDERGLVFSKIFPTIPTIDDYCVFPREECPPGTCECDCNPHYICCYGKDGKVKKLIYK